MIAGIQKEGKVSDRVVDHKSISLQLVPSEITVELIKKAIGRKKKKQKKKSVFKTNLPDNNAKAYGYLIDGFPRNITQAEMFEKGICKAKTILNLEGWPQTAITQSRSIQSSG